jgi:hypothetical protein
MATTCLFEITGKVVVIINERILLLNKVIILFITANKMIRFYRNISSKKPLLENIFKLTAG